MEPLTKNRILRTLEATTQKRVLERCQRVELYPEQVLSIAGEDQTTVYFPEDCVISTVASFRDGATIEVANTGREGCTGYAPTLNSALQLNGDIAQVGGLALAMETAEFFRLKNEYPPFEAALFSALRGLIQQIMISNACNAMHPARQRLARWLLTMNDRTPGKTIELTQDFLAQILGVRRATISEASAVFRTKNLIDYARGKLVIRDREGLRGEACECYDLVADAYRQFLPLESETNTAGLHGTVQTK